ncbi:hypothetical protein GGX14DRAFT_514246 [Mycena pura]|uniref:Arf-GAP domain-containing protein n=1 Tax=Mycena pura TaxID=153505 RepID=A0AAD6YL58_9AGAR|nr:hypothetical protein GGX14DRAFT_514246 [Mycena pura]
MARQSQDKATTDKFTKTLRELVRRPDNKVCADCKHNDPRWASWNLGVFLCIRCSGVHRGMGTHISKVKSVDLDVWTPEQMENIQKWGNRLANLYWEARLKPGHIPPEQCAFKIAVPFRADLTCSKVESFIRSKYESRRWAMDGPPPQDPSALDSEPVATEEPDAAHVPPAVAAPPDPIGWSAASPPRSSNSTVNRQPQSRQLLSATHANNVPLMKPPPQQQTAAAAPPPQPKAQDDIFSLDFHAPVITASPPPPKNAKEDILSLFSTSTAAPAMSAVNQYGQFHQQPSMQNHWGAAPVQQPVQPQSMMGTSGAGMWGTSSGWTAPQSPQSQNVWGTPSTQQNSFVATAASTNVWGGMGAGSGGTTDLFSTSFAQSAQQKKDDVFGDLWK